MNQQPRITRLIPELAVVLGCCVAAIVALVWFSKIYSGIPAPDAAARPAGEREAAAAVPPAESAGGFGSSVEEQWGIRVSGIKLTNANLGLELRYQVTDPEKASQLNDGATAASIRDDATGTTIRIGAPPPRAGAVSQHSRARSAALMMRDGGSFPPVPSRIVPGKTYSVLLPNPPGRVKRGSRVVVVVGDFRTESITVQ